MKIPRILKRWAFLYRQRNGRPWLVRGAANPLKARLYRDRLLERGYLCGDILPIFLPVPDVVVKADGSKQISIRRVT